MALQGRKIRWRGRTRKGMWYYGDLLRINEKIWVIVGNGEAYIDDKLIELHRHRGSVFSVVQALTVGQFTGCEDMIGKEIYEGDIILGHHFSYYKDCHWLVEFKGGAFVCRRLGKASSYEKHRYYLVPQINGVVVGYKDDPQFRCYKDEIFDQTHEGNLPKVPD